MQTVAEKGLPGRLIAVEGLDGSGKTTQIYLLRRWLEVQGLKVYLNEWSSSKLLKSATSKAKSRELLTPITFSLLHATEFADRYERQIVPLLKAGYLVLCDRYFFTPFARDIVRGCPSEWVRGLYDYAALPDLTFFFNADLETCVNRVLDSHPQLDYFDAGMDLRLSPDPYESYRAFQVLLQEQYLDMSTKHGFAMINAADGIEGQQSMMRRLVAGTINLDKYVMPSPDM